MVTILKTVNFIVRWYRTN